MNLRSFRNTPLGETYGDDGTQYKRPLPKNSQRHGFYIAFGLMAMILGLWEFLPRLEVADPLFIPSVSGVISETARLVLGGQIIGDVSATLWRLGVGYGTGSFLGLAVALVAGYYSKLRAPFKLYTISLFALPKVALLPIFILWFGVGELTKIIIVALGAYFPVAIASYLGIRAVEQSLVDTALLEGASGYRLMLQIALPCAANTILAGLTTAVMTSIAALITAEMLAANRGLGFLLLNSQQLLLTRQLFATLLVIAVLSITIFRLLETANSSLFSDK